MSVRTLQVGNLVSHEARPDECSGTMPFLSVDREDAVRANRDGSRPLSQPFNRPRGKLGREYRLDIFGLVCHEHPDADIVHPVGRA